MPVILPLVLQSVWPACLPFRPPQGLAGRPRAPDCCPPTHQFFFFFFWSPRATESSYLPAAFVPRLPFFFMPHICAVVSATQTFIPPPFSLCAHLRGLIYLSDTGRLSELSAQLLFSLVFFIPPYYFSLRFITGINSGIGSTRPNVESSDWRGRRASHLFAPAFSGSAALLLPALHGWCYQRRGMSLCLMTESLSGRRRLSG